MSHSATKLSVCEVWKAVPKKWRPLVPWGDKSNLPPIKLNSLQLRQKLTVALLGTSQGTRRYRQRLTMLIVWFDSVTRIWICPGWYALILRLMITRQISIHCLTVRQCLGVRRIVTNNTGVSTRFVIQTEWMSPYQRYVSFHCYKGLLVRRQSPKRATSMFHKLHEPDYVGPIKAPEYLLSLPIWTGPLLCLGNGGPVQTGRLSETASYQQICNITRHITYLTLD